MAGLKLAKEWIDPIECREVHTPAGGKYSKARLVKTRTFLEKVAVDWPSSAMCWGVQNPTGAGHGLLKSGSQLVFTQFEFQMFYAKGRAERRFEQLEYHFVINGRRW
jgi:hypothetical protein